MHIVIKLNADLKSCPMLGDKLAKEQQDNKVGDNRYMVRSKFQQTNLDINVVG